MPCCICFSSLFRLEITFLLLFCCRPVIDFNELTHHFIECIHVHLENTRQKVVMSEIHFMWFRFFSFCVNVAVSLCFMASCCIYRMVHYSPHFEWFNLLICCIVEVQVVASMGSTTPFINDQKGYQTSIPNQVS